MLINLFKLKVSYTWYYLVYSIDYWNTEIISTICTMFYGKARLRFFFLSNRWLLLTQKNKYMFNVYKNQQSRQTVSRNLMGPKTFPLIWGTYMKLVTKDQISAINSCWEKCDEKCAYTVHSKWINDQTLRSDIFLPKCPTNLRVNTLYLVGYFGRTWEWILKDFFLHFSRWICQTFCDRCVFVSVLSFPCVECT